jgi:ATP-binding cassette subfamily B protein
MSTQPARYGTLCLYRRLLAQARPYWIHVLAFLLLSLLATPLTLLAPVPLKIAVDSILGTRPLPPFMQSIMPEAAARTESTLLLLVAAMVIVIALLALLQNLGTALLKTYLAEKLVINWRSQMFRHVQRLSVSYHDTQGSYDSSYRIQYDAQSIQTVVIDSLIPMISATWMLGGMMYVTARLNLRLALVAIAISPPLLVITSLFRRRLRQQWREVRKLESSAQSIVQEVLGAVRVVKAFGREDHEHARFVSQSATGMAARLRTALEENFYGLLVGLLTAAGTAAVLYIGVGEVRSGALSLGNLVIAMAYLAKLYDPLRSLGKQLATKQRALASAERAFALLDQAPDVPERPDARPLARAAGAVSFRDVSFGYGDGPTVLHHVSFDVPPGTRVGVAGRTGAGKTTLVNLLTRFFDPGGGQILLDGVDLRDYRLADLRNQFSIVLQEPVLFSASIEENIGYGRAGATHDEIVAAATAANADEFIEALPQGYQTQVGERGMSLSGGERQRISLARAFLRDAPVLILDEPTSSIDLKTEAGIMAAMERLMSGRTAFLIAHRPATLEGCDVLLRVDNGRVLEASPGPREREGVAALAIPE